MAITCFLHSIKSVNKSGTFTFKYSLVQVSLDYVTTLLLSNQQSERNDDP